MGEHGARPSLVQRQGPPSPNTRGTVPGLELLPNTVERDLYCTGGASCAHRLPRHFQRVLSTKTLAPASLLVKPNGKGGGRGGDRGGDGGRGGADKRNNGEGSDAQHDRESGAKEKKYPKKKAKAKDLGDN